MRHISLKIALLAATASIATAAPALADTTTTDSGAQSTPASNDDNATLKFNDITLKGGGISSAGDAANPDGSIQAI